MSELIRVAPLGKRNIGIHMYFSGFMARFLMLRVFAKEYVGDRSKSASESVVAVSEPMKRYVSSWWRAAR